MFILIYYFLTVLAAVCQPQNHGNYQKLQYSTKTPSNKQWKMPNYNRGQWQRYINFKQRNYSKPNQQVKGDAGILMNRKVNSMQVMKDENMYKRRRDAYYREGKMSTWGVTKAKDRLYTARNVPTNTELPARRIKWSSYNRVGSTNADIGVKTAGMRLSKDKDASLGNRSGVTVDKLQESSARRVYNPDIPQFGKSEIPTDELRKTLKNIDEQLTKYENGIYKLFKPNYLDDNPKLQAIKKQDLPIDDKVHTLLKTLKTSRKGAAFPPVGDISDISI